MEIVEKSPTAIAIAKRSFNADTENIRGISSLGMQALALYYGTAESKEGGEGFAIVKGDGQGLAILVQPELRRPGFF